MKKVFIFALLAIFLSSCTMFPNKKSDEQLFYGDSLAHTKETPMKKKVNSSFIYNYEDDHKDDDCI